MQHSSLPGAARLEVGAPKLFRAGAVARVSAYGLLVMLPVLLSMLAISVMPLGLLTFSLPLAAIAFATFFLPCGFGNPLIGRLVRRLKTTDEATGAEFIVQLTLVPRVRTGLRALIEDADDVGWLRFTQSELHFHGDSIRLSVPFDQIEGLRSRNIGWRGLFAYGPRTTFSVPSLPQVQSFQVAERSSWLLPDSRRTARSLFELFQKAQDPNSPKGAPPP